MLSADPRISEWSPLRELGWRVLRGPERLACDRVIGPSWIVSRVWSTAGTIQATELPSNAFRLLIGIEGEPSARLGESRVPLCSQQIMLVPAEEGLTMEMGAPWARMEWQFSSTQLKHSRFEKVLLRPLDIPDHSYSLLTSITNSISTAPEFGKSRGSRMFSHVLATITAAVLVDQPEMMPYFSPSQEQTFYQAANLIEHYYADPSFNIDTLVSMLPVGKSYLHRLFGFAGTTPRRYLETRRVMSALSLIDSPLSQGYGGVREIAELSGFASLETMQAAIQRQGREASASAGRE